MAREIIVVKIVLDDSEVNAKAAAVGRKIKSGLDPVVSGVNSLKSAVSGLNLALAALGAVGLVAVKSMASAALDAAINLDKTRNTLIALTGSADAANKKLAELRQLAKASPGVTTSFATQLFAQLKAIGEVSDQTINKVIQSLGKLNTVFSDVGPEFARNLVQIFQQGFERSDIKEALGRVPIFEQLLESAFGTKDPNKLRQLKAAGELTMDAFLTGVSDQIQKRFPNVRDSLASQLEKAKDDIAQALVPLGEDLAKILIDNKDNVIALVKAFGELTKAVLNVGKELGGLWGRRH